MMAKRKWKKEKEVMKSPTLRKVSVVEAMETLGKESHNPDDTVEKTAEEERLHIEAEKEAEKLRIEAEEEEEVNFDYFFNKTAFFGVFSIYSRVQKST